MNAYYQIFSDIPDTEYESAVSWLERELELSLTKAYEEIFEDADVRHFNDTKRRLYTLFFDCTQDWSDDIYGRAARVVFVYGLSAPGLSERIINGCGSFAAPLKINLNMWVMIKVILLHILMMDKLIKTFIPSLKG